MRSPKGIILAVVLFLGIISWRSFDAKRKSDSSFEMAAAVVSQLPEYDQNKVFFDSKLPEFHQRAYRLALKRGRFKSSFSDSLYRTVLLKQFMNEAESTGNTEVLKAMQRELEDAAQ